MAQIDCPLAKVVLKDLTIHFLNGVLQFKNEFISVHAPGVGIDQASASSELFRRN